MTECQLYLISPLETGGAFPDRLRHALDAGSVAAFQFRVKDMGEHDAARLAEPLQSICQERDVAFVVNDSISLAKRLNADGLHLGQKDGDLKDARERLGKDVQIGVTCHASRELSMDAGEAGADYVAFGAFFPSETKDSSHIADLELIEWWARIFELPCVAIGGITPQNCAPIVQAGADFLAVSHGVWGGDEANAVNDYAQAIKAALTAAD